MKNIKLENKQIPLHYQISDYLIIMLERGDLSPEEKLPSEEELRKIFNVSRTTIRRSLEHLLNKGLLTKQQGKSTFWTNAVNKIVNKKLSGINREIFKITEKTKVKVLSKKNSFAPSEVDKFFNNTGNYTVFKRLRYSNDEPMSYTINYMLNKTGDKILKTHLTKMTMLETLEKIVKIKLGAIKHEVEITRVNSEIAENLKIAILDPVLTVKTSVYDIKQKPVEIVWTHFVENKYIFKVIFE
jgi:DNA-binding GntR family transcriptional regulator